MSCVSALQHVQPLNNTLSFPATLLQYAGRQSLYGIALDVKSGRQLLVLLLRNLQHSAGMDTLRWFSSHASLHIAECCKSMSVERLTSAGIDTVRWFSILSTEPSQCVHTCSCYLLTDIILQHSAVICKFGCK